MLTTIDIIYSSLIDLAIAATNHITKNTVSKFIIYLYYYKRAYTKY